MTTLIALFVVSGLSVWFVVIPLRSWLIRSGIVDYPGDQRRLHRDPTPRGGGLALALVLVFGVLAYGGIVGVWAWAGGSALLMIMASALGWLEDLRPRSVGLRLALQALIALAVLYFLGPIGSIVLVDVLGASQWLWTFLGWVAVIWLMNLYNFMDGSDGLAVSQGIWACLCYAVLFACAGQMEWAALATLTSGGLAGLWLWNRPVARIFMGDSGSLLVGLMIGLLAYAGLSTQSVSLGASLVISAVFIVDATATLVWRVFKGQRWYTAHASHAFQRLIAGGLSHAQVLALYVVLNVGLGGPMLYAILRWPEAEYGFVAALVSVLWAGWQWVQSGRFGLKLKG